MRNTRLKKEPEPLHITQILKACMRVILSIFRMAWEVIRVIWYWFERIFLVALLLWLTVGLAWWLSQKPSLYRDWLLAESVLPEIAFSWETVAIKNIRNHTWTTDKEFTPGYYDTAYNIADLEKVYYIITPFSDRDWPAHTMLSFSFSWGQHVVISAEVRKERGEDFDALKGILNQYELMYVIADESDVIKLRTNYRKNEVYMYPIDTSKEKVQELFRTMLIRADKLSREPEFYNTLWNNCTTSILMHANALRTEKLSGGIYRILPSHSDEIVYGAWLIDTELSLGDARAYYRIDESARAMTGTVDFSDIIRKPIR